MSRQILCVLQSDKYSKVLGYVCGILKGISLQQLRRFAHG